MFHGWEVRSEFEQDGVGLQELELQPHPIVIDEDEITLDIASKVCQCLQIDLDRVLFTQEQIELPDHPPMMHVQRFIRIMVKNHDDYELGKMHPAMVKTFIGVLASHFINALRDAY